ncbi:MAG: C1 family peptidase [Bacteroidales bacterium]|nr:C1 family peptidase [Bacteroidales bacterium]MDD4670203.1 C1 family peptidase [Bacteroidales bacterium]
MKKITLLLAAILLFNMSAFAQESKSEKAGGFQFTTVKELPITKIQNQASSGTCWCFSTVSFLESEILRNGYKGDLNLSEMFIISHAYADKAVKYIRVDGNLNFAGGSSFGDALTVFKDYGAVPESLMTGLNYGENRHVHGELDAVTKGYVSALLKNPNRKLSTAWKAGFQGILDAYLGKIPEEFEYNGAKYTPKSYAESLGINPDDYVSLTSFTHVPFYKQFAIEVADNWRWELSYNLPLDELIAVMYNAIDKGYTFAWASDVSEKGFTRNGVATVPDMEALTPTGSDEARWIGLTPQERDRELAKKMEGPVAEKAITPELRQKEYDNKLTTDDHGMHIFGIATDQNGRKYFMVKNSWGESGKYKGIWYVSEAFVKYKTMDILVHKDAIPKDIKKKLGIK